MKPTQSELVSLVAGDLDAATLAARHGASEADVQVWRSAFLDGMKTATAMRARSWVRARWLLALGLVGTAASAQLVTFGANQPALAADVNGNFTQLKNWLEAKVGPVGSSGITTSTISATAVTSTSVSSTTASTGDLTASGNVNLGGAGKTLGVFGTVNQFGASQNMVLGTNYTAGSDGFVLGTVNVTGACNTGQAIMYGYAGGGSASELRGVASVHAGCSGTDYATPYGSVFMLVRKGEVYKVDLSATGAQSSRATFTPIGR